MTVLVTGLSGFVGGHISRLFGATDLGQGSEFVDLRNKAAVREAVARVAPAAVIHLAAQSSVPAAIARPDETFEVNFLGTFNLLNALNETGFGGRFLYVGSADMYGAVPDNELPVLESRGLRPRNPYAVSKVAAEALCYQWSQTGRFEILMARPFNHIGPGQGTQFAVADFAWQISQMRRGKRDYILQTGDIDTTRDFTDVRDIVRAYRALLDTGINGEIYNVCSGVERSMREIIVELSGIAGVDVRIETAPERLRHAEQRRMKGSFELLRAHTGWVPVIPMETTLRDILNHWDMKEDV